VVYFPVEKKLVHERHDQAGQMEGLAFNLFGGARHPPHSHTATA
jgi:hypothetical protein